MMIPSPIACLLLHGKYKPKDFGSIFEAIKATNKGFADSEIITWLEAISKRGKTRRRWKRWYRDYYEPYDLRKPEALQKFDFSTPLCTSDCRLLFELMRKENDTVAGSIICSWLGKHTPKVRSARLGACSEGFRH